MGGNLVVEFSKYFLVMEKSVFFHWLKTRAYLF